MSRQANVGAAAYRPLRSRVAIVTGTIDTDADAVRASRVRLPSCPLVSVTDPLDGPLWAIGR